MNQALSTGFPKGVAPFGLAVVLMPHPRRRDVRHAFRRRRVYELLPFSTGQTRLHLSAVEASLFKIRCCTLRCIFRAIVISISDERVITFPNQERRKELMMK